MNIHKRIYNYVFSVTSTSENEIRRERILNVLLVGMLFLATIFLIVYFVGLSYVSENRGAQPLIVSVFVLAFWALFFFAKAGYHRIVIHILIGILITAAAYTSLMWGVITPQGLLMFALIIVMAGILENSRFALNIFLICVVLLFTISYLQINNIVTYSMTWVEKPFDFRDIVEYVVTLGIITLVSWLSNREIENALKRARISEKALLKERDSLEETVEKRTQEIQTMQMEKIMGIYQFADFGKLTAGLFHDLITPLNTVSINLENIKDETKDSTLQNIKEVRQALKRAIHSTKDIEKFVITTRQQLQGQQTKTYFNLATEIDIAIAGLKRKAVKAEVDVNFTNRNVVHTFGNSYRFHQLINNLVSNAIDAYSSVSRSKNRMVNVSVWRQGKMVTLEVKDFAIGMPLRVLHHIFDPFFSTKPTEQGMGIGLTICKDIVEREFGGTITVQSKLHEGTTFLVKLPIVKKHG